MSMSLESTLAMIQAQSAQREAQRAAQRQSAQQSQQSQQSQQPQQAQQSPSSTGTGCPCTAAQQARGAQWNQFQGSGADAQRQAAPQPDAQANPQALYGENTAANASADAQAPAQAQAFKTNQDVINHAYAQGGNTWAGASKVAQSMGVNLNDLVKNRQGAPSLSAAATTPNAATPAATPNATAPNATAPNTPAATTPNTSGAVRPSGANLTGTQFGNSIGDAAEREARRMNTVGRCALGVNNALISQGVPGRGHAYQKADQLAQNPRFREVSMSPSELSKLPRGAVVVWGKSAAKPYGHVSVALGDGREASDHIQRQITRGSQYNGVRVFLPQ